MMVYTQSKPKAAIIARFASRDVRNAICKALLPVDGIEKLVNENLTKFRKQLFTRLLNSSIEVRELLWKAKQLACSFI